MLQFATKRSSNKELSSSNSSLSSTSETANESTSPNTPEAAPRTRRRVRHEDTPDRRQSERGLPVSFYFSVWITMHQLSYRGACPWTPSPTWTTTIHACWRRCSSPCQPKLPVRRRNTGTKGWVWILSTVRCHGLWTAAVSTSRNMVSTPCM